MVLVDSNGIAWFCATGQQGVIGQSRDESTDDRWSGNVTGVSRGYETTMIAKSLGTSGDAHFASKLFGGNHSGGDASSQRWYDLGIRENGDVQLQWEGPHPNNHTFTLPAAKQPITNIGVTLDGNWIGLKWLVYKILATGGSPANGGVRCVMWVNTSIATDGRPNNANWRKVLDFIDGVDVEVIDPQDFEGPDECDLEIRRSDTDDHEIYAGGHHWRKLSQADITAFNNGGTTNPPPPPPPPTGQPGNIDQFGIKMIYPTKEDGQTWFQTNDPESDGQLISDVEVIRREGDYFIADFPVNAPGATVLRVATDFGDTGTQLPCDSSWSNFASQGHVLTGEDWKNVEITGVVYIQEIDTDAEGTDGQFDFSFQARASPGFTDESPTGCCGVFRYSGVLLTNNTGEFAGKVRFNKVMGNAGPNRTENFSQTLKATFYRSWTGFKFIVYNTVGTNNEIWVTVELWLCPSDSSTDLLSNWTKVASFIDKGNNWGTSGENCGGTAGQAFTWGTPTISMAYGRELPEVRWKKWSVREIDINGEFPTDPTDPPPEEPPCEEPPPEEPPTGTIGGVNITAAMNFIRNSYDSSVQMLEEAPGFNVFWLWNDQLLGQIILKHNDPSMSQTVENKMNSFAVAMKTPWATLDPQYRVNFSVKQATEPTVSAGPPAIRYSHYGGVSDLLVTDFADIAFLSAIHYYYMGDNATALTAYNAGKAMWDGDGMLDDGNITGDYAVYKVALGLLAQKITGFSPIGIPDNFFAVFQHANGGITTDKTAGVPAGSQNVETTVAVLLALNPQFLIPPGAPPNTTLNRFISWGDNDTTSDATAVLDQIFTETSVAQYLFAGDGPYSDDSTDWINMMSGYFNTVALKNKLMLAQGNHEHTESESQESEDQIEAWFPGLANTNDSLDWLQSKKVGNAYVIVLNSQDENFTDIGGDQYNYVQTQLTLAKQMRASGQIDWIIAMVHKSWFNLLGTNQAYVQARHTYAAMFNDAQVDFMFHGHNHSYAIWRPVVAIAGNNTNTGALSLSSFAANGTTYDLSKQHGAFYIINGNGGHEINSWGEDPADFPNVLYANDQDFGYTVLDIQGKQATITAKDVSGAILFIVKATRGTDTAQLTTTTTTSTLALTGEPCEPPPPTTPPESIYNDLVIVYNINSDSDGCICNDAGFTPPEPCPEGQTRNSAGTCVPDDDPDPDPDPDPPGSTTAIYSVRHDASSPDDIRMGDENRTSYYKKFGSIVLGEDSPVSDKDLKRIEWPMAKVGNPTGNATILIRRGSDDSIAKTLGTVNVQDLTTSFEYKAVENTSTTYNIVTDDRILIEYTGGDEDNYILVRATAEQQNDMKVTKQDHTMDDDEWRSRDQEAAWIGYA